MTCREHVMECGMRLTEQDYRLDAVTMAKALLGMTLCRRLDDGSVVRARIIETEA